MSIVVTNNQPQAAAAETPAVQGTPVPAAEAAAEQNASVVSEATETEEQDAADESDDAGGDEPEVKADDAAKDKPKKKSGSQRNRERAERAEAELKRLQGVMEELARKNAGDTKTDPAPKPAAGDKKPDPNDYDSHAEYVEDLTDWKLGQKLKERDQKAEQDRLKTEQDKAFSTHQERVRAFAEKTKDFHDVIEEVADLPLAPVVESILVSSEHGPEIMYELARNPEEFKRVNALPPLAAAVELGTIKARLTSQASVAAKPEPKKTTSAPKPIEPNGNRGGGSVKSIYDPGISQKDFERLVREQQKQTGARWG